MEKEQRFDMTTVIDLQITINDHSLSQEDVDNEPDEEKFNRVLEKLFELDLAHFGDIRCNVIKRKKFVMPVKGKKEEKK